MPFPAYHIGVNGFFGLLFRKWVDPAVIVLGNVVVDLEVLFAPGWPNYHRHWHFHSFLVGGLVGALFGVVCWLFKGLFNRSMRLIRIPYEARLWKMVLAGVLGIWIHVIVDGFYHWDVQPFWPYKKNILRQLKHGIRQDRIEVICLVFAVTAILLYVRTVIIFNRKRAKTAPSGDNSTHN